jgi:hypothetical protein
MSGLDYSLIHEAQRYITGDNVHYVNTWIFCYQTSMPDSAQRERYGKLLREFVVTKRLTMAARVEAVLARRHSKNVRSLSDVLNRQIDEQSLLP